MFISIALRGYLGTSVGWWILTSYISRIWSFSSKGTHKHTRPAIRPTDDWRQHTSSPSVVERSPEAAKSSWWSHYRAKKPNTGARQPPHEKLFGWSVYWMIWVFLSRIWFSFTATTWAVSTWLVTPYSTRGLSISKCTITSFESAFRLEISFSTHQHEPSGCWYLHKSLRSRQAWAISIRPWSHDICIAGIPHNINQRSWKQ